MTLSLVFLLLVNHQSLQTLHSVHKLVLKLLTAFAQISDVLPTCFVLQLVTVSSHAASDSGDSGHHGQRHAPSNRLAN